VLNEKMVEIIVTARKQENKMRKCDNKRKLKEEKWGPMLVERQRMRQDREVPIMQKAMQLK
jgi:hypothetical protein